MTHPKDPRKCCEECRGNFADAPGDNWRDYCKNSRCPCGHQPEAASRENEYSPISRLGKPASISPASRERCKHEKAWCSQCHSEPLQNALDEAVPSPDQNKGEDLEAIQLEFGSPGHLSTPRWEERVVELAAEAGREADLVAFIKELLVFEYNRGYEDGKNC